MPPRKRWTVANCEVMEQTGLLSGHYELIEGEIIEKMGQKPLHTSALMLLAFWLASIFDPLQIRQEKPMPLNGDPAEINAPEPDICVSALPVTDYTNRHPGPKDALLVVEVSDTTLAYDLTTKAALYARGGVQEYWVLDIPGRRMTVHRRPAPDGYREVIVYSAEEMVSLLARPDSTVSVAAILPPSDSTA